ncbi:hypothetical protein DFJ58DRAFT_792424, partial [Suillus subalutaceus]|uniref:uncharacterized protein n=1 Tax=Suillus subalutaceus TaxID=48586 RepID=UPI001B86F705
MPTPIDPCSYRLAPKTDSQTGRIKFSLPFGASYEAQPQITSYDYATVQYFASTPSSAIATIFPRTNLSNRYPSSQEPCSEHVPSYVAPPYTLHASLSEDEIQTAVSLLRKKSVAVDLASRLYDHTSAARFAHHRLHLPCITFPVTEVSLRPSRDQDTCVCSQVRR